MEQSILKSTKKILGVGDSDSSFDLDIMTHINSVFSILSQLGIGPEVGYMIEDDDAEWGDLFGDDNNLNSVKTYVFLRVRMLFDPPSTSFHLTAVNEQIKELEVRINTYRESYAWVNPNPMDLAIDGGTP